MTERPPGGVAPEEGEPTGRGPAGDVPVAGVPLTKAPGEELPAAGDPVADGPLADGPLAGGRLPGGPAEVPPAVKAPRLRASRGVTAAVVATVTLILSAALLVDVIAVRTGHAAAQWRAELADGLATRPLDDVWVMIGGCAAVVIGIWLLWLAVAPGLRQWVSLRPQGWTTAAVERIGVATLLYDRARDLPGIERITIKAGRRRVAVHLTGPADPAAVERQLREELARIPLVAPPRLDVRSAGVRTRGGAR